MLPGFSSKNNFKNNYNQDGGAKKLKFKKHSDHDNDDNEDDHNGFNEILLQYNLERMNEEQQYDFSHCDTHRDAYPFASSLSRDTDTLFDTMRTDYYDSDSGNDSSDYEDQAEAQRYGENIEIYLCTYQINTSCELPFLEYLMILSEDKDKDDGKKVFELPKFNYISSKRKSVEKQAEEHILKMLMSNEDAAGRANDDDDHVVKFRGILKHVSGSKYESKKMKSSFYIFFQKYFKKPKHPPQLSKRDNVWWVVSSEIVNFKKVMYMDIDPVVTDLFIKNPEIMRLYDCKGRLLETPTICYFGDEFQKIKYLAFFGLLKAPVKSSFGPFYVATNFLSSMKYACYTHNQQPFELYGGEKITSGEHGKYKQGGVLRMILFIGKMKVFLKDGEPDDSQISQELAKTDKTVEKFLSLRDSNGNWTEEYDTAYNGLHFASINDDIVVNPLEWFFKDYNHSTVISFHNIDTAKIPDKFDVDYVDYKLK